MNLRARVVPIALLAVLSAVFVGGAPAGSLTAQTKRTAERNLLRIAARSWSPERLPDLIDSRTHLLRDNVRAICQGRGHELDGRRFRRFVCVIRAWPARGRQELYVTYNVLANGRFRAHWLRIRRG